MNYSETDHMARGFSPLGLDAHEMWPHQELGHSSTARRPSDNLSTTTDSPNDPTPDGNGMDFGNDNCHSPDSVCTNGTDLYDGNISPSRTGTPNSFIGYNDPTSPNRFPMHTRERLMSSCSSAYTYSPYTPKEQDDDAIFNIPTNTPYPVRSVPPCFMTRQTSLAIVEEVLGCSDAAYDERGLEGLSQPTPSPDNYSEDSCMPPYPSPSFSAHFNASTNPAQQTLTSSQTEDYFDTFCFEPSPEVQVAQCAGSPPPSSEASQTLSPSNSNSNNNCSGAESATTGNDASPVTEAQETAVHENNGMYSIPHPQATMSRTTTDLSDIFTDSMPSDSLDAYAMMKDCLDGLPKTQEPELKTIEMSILCVKDDTQPLEEAQERVEQPIQRPKKIAKRRERKTPVPKTFVDPEEQIPSTSKADPTTFRREKNNAACRLSRKRRKDKREEMDHLVVHYSTENVQLEEKIKDLEVEVKRVREAILSTMTAGHSR